MKLFLLIIFLALSFALPMYYITVNRQENMLIKILSGIAIYVLSTILMNFCCKAIGYEDINQIPDIKYYVALLSLIMTFVIFVFSRFKNLYNDKKTATLIYCGFAFVNFFINNMNSYMNLLYIGMNNSIEKLSKRYPSEIAQGLLDYYNKINTIDILLLSIELIVVFYITKILFEKVINKDLKILNYLFFMIGIFVLYNIQYSINSVEISFMLYFLLFGFLVLMSKSEYGKHKIKNN